MVNVLSSFETDGTADIFIQLEKLSYESWKLPEQLLSLVLVVTVPVEIFSLNVTEIVVETETSEELSVGVVEEMMGLMVSAAPNFS